MKKVMHKLFLAATLTVFFLCSCEKEPGEGGNSTIFGKVYVKNYNALFTDLIGEYYGPDEDVYIIYGGNDGTSDLGYGYDDDVKTSYDGSFKFEFLRPGKYTIYVYSEDSTLQSPSGVLPIIQEIEITEKNQEVEIPDFIIFN